MKSMIFFLSAGHAFIYSFSQHFNTYISILGASLMAKNKYIPIKMLKENEQIKNMTSVEKNHTLYIMTLVSGICFGL